MQFIRAKRRQFSIRSGDPQRWEASVVVNPVIEPEMAFSKLRSIIVPRPLKETDGPSTPGKRRECHVTEPMAW